MSYGACHFSYVYTLTTLLRLGPDRPNEVKNSRGMMVTNLGTAQSNLQRGLVVPLCQGSCGEFLSSVNLM